MVYYSKKHVDIARALPPEEPQYYMVVSDGEVQLTRDQLYHYAKYHNIPRCQERQIHAYPKPELDKLLAALKIG